MNTCYIPQGYRTPLSGKSDLANAFAHQYIGRLWWKIGLVSLPVTEPVVKHEPVEERQVVAQVVERTPVEGPMPIGNGGGGRAMPKILAETDIPITSPENLEYTPEELALIKRQERLAYVSRIRLEIEIAEKLLAESKI